MVNSMPANEAGKVEICDVGDAGDAGDAARPSSADAHVGDVGDPRFAGAGGEDKVHVGDVGDPRFAGAGGEDKVGDVGDAVFEATEIHDDVAELEESSESEEESSFVGNVGDAERPRSAGAGGEDKVCNVGDAAGPGLAGKGIASARGVANA